jgi:HEAT repeat protein/energy-coupling factor transporter ATP-binding protein EcfA2
MFSDREDPRIEGDSLYHTDRFSAYDHLHFSDFRPVLREVLLHAQTPLTVGLFGAWGSGKTTLLRMLRRDIEATGKKVHTVWFTAWKYDRNEALWRAFILRVLDALYPRSKGDSAEPWEFRERVAPEKLDKEQQEIAEMLLHLEESIYRPAEWQELGRIALDWRRMVPEATKAAGILAEYLVPGGKWVRQMMEALSGAEKSGPDLEKTFSAIRREAQKHRLEQLTSMEQFEFTLQKVLRRVLGDDGRLVVFVDDLDRCLPEKAIEILETIKLFLEVEGTVFALGMDKAVIERGIEVRYKSFSPKAGSTDAPPIQGDDYLQKIIQIPFYLPPIDERDIRGLIDGLENPKVAGEPDSAELEHALATERQRLSTTTLEVMERGLVPNPRQVKRVLNVFRLLQGIALVREHKRTLRTGEVAWPLLAKTVIIQAQYPELYQQWCLQPNLVAWLEDEFERISNASASAERTAQESGDGPAADRFRRELIAPFVDPNQWRRYKQLKEMLLHPPKDRDGKGREHARFSGLGPGGVGLYLRLAGSVEMEGAFQAQLGELWEDIRSGQMERVQAATEKLLADEAGEKRTTAAHLIGKLLDEHGSAGLKKVAWAEALARLGGATERELAFDTLTALGDADAEAGDAESVWSCAVGKMAALRYAPLLPRLVAWSANPQRRPSVFACFELFGDQAVESLRQLLGEDRPVEVRVDAVRTLQHCGGAHAVEILRSSLHDRSDRVRVQLVAAFAQHSHDTLLEMVADPAEPVREAAITRAAAIGGPLIAQLLNLFDAASPLTRESALAAIERMDVGQLAPLAAMLHGGSKRTRANARLGLLRKGVDALPLLAGYAAGNPTSARWRDAAADVLAGIGPPAIEGLADRAADADADTDVRLLACAALALMDPGQLNEHTWRKLLSIESRDPALEKAAAGLVSRIDAQALEHCVALLDDSDERVRTKAFAILLDNGRSTVGALATLMERPLRGNAERIVQLLIKLNGVERVQPSLLEHLSSMHRDFRRVAVATLDSIGDPDAVAVLLSLFKDEDAELRTAIVRTLGSIGHSDVVEPLVNIVKSDTSVRSEAVRALLATNDPTAVEYLARLGQEVLGDCADLLDAGDVSIRNSARQAIAAMTLSDLAPVRDRLLEPAPKRDALVAALAAQGARIVPAIVAFMEGNELNQAQIDVLSTIVATAARPIAQPLLQYLHHPNQRVRKFAIDALGELHDPQAVEALQALLTEDDPAIVGAVWTALIKVGIETQQSSRMGPAALETLLNLSQAHLVEQILRRDPSLLRELLRASHMLESKGNGGVWNVLDQAHVASEKLLNYIRDPEPAVASAAAQALGRSKKAGSIVPRLIAILEDFEDEALHREAAAEALGYIGDPVVIAPLLQYLDANPEKHGAAKDALVRIGEPAAVAIDQHRNAVSVKKLRALNPIYDELVTQIRSSKDGESAKRRVRPN